MPNLDDLSEDQISHCLLEITNKTFDDKVQTDQSIYKKASILIPFVRKDDSWHLLFIRRAESEKDTHSGQVAFVGGKAEGFDDSDIDTALRETEEEIGINPVDIKILGRLGFHYSISNFEISPIVATIPWPYQLKLDPAEVSHTFTLPLSWLADEKNHDIRSYQLPESKQKTAVVYFKEHEGELLWGATARMVLSLVKALKQL